MFASRALGIVAGAAAVAEEEGGERGVEDQTSTQNLVVAAGMQRPAGRLLKIQADQDTGSYCSAS